MNPADATGQQLMDTADVNGNQTMDTAHVIRLFFLFKIETKTQKAHTPSCPAIRCPPNGSAG